MLFTANSLLPSNCLQEGVFVSGQQLQRCEIDRISQQMSQQMDDSLNQKTGVPETQVWGVPWSEQQFIEQMVKFGHPMNLQSNLPNILREAADAYNSMDAQKRMAWRTGQKNLVFG